MQDLLFKKGVELDSLGWEGRFFYSLDPKGLSEAKMQKALCDPDGAGLGCYSCSEEYSSMFHQPWIC